VFFGLFALIALYLVPPVKSASSGDATPRLESSPQGDLERLTKLHELLQAGAIGEEEYEYQKSLVLRPAG
jgi:hypothetical protein